MSDPVNHPKHYNAHPSGVECITVVEHFNFNRGNAMKYIWRAGEKGGDKTLLEDLEKARWYIDREIQRLGGLGMFDDPTKVIVHYEGTKPQIEFKGREVAVVLVDHTMKAPSNG